jgi:hypothetical protein
MKSQPFALGAIAVVALLSSLITAHFAPAGADGLPSDADGGERVVPRSVVDEQAVAGAREAEMDRVRAHLLAAEQYLLARPVAELTPEQAERRAANIALLREYRARGQFPHNTEFPHRRVPYLVDSEGRLGALSFLMVRSGERDLLHRLAATQNNARVDQLARNAELVEWLRREGLTVEEAARVQPTHGPSPLPDR